MDRSARQERAAELTRSARPPALVAHRGASRERLENSLPAFLRALELGADGIELDVHATRDGVVVVHHDPQPRGTPPRAGLSGLAIADLSACDVAQFDLGGGERIPTLASVLDAVAGRVEMFVELKGRGIERQVVEVVLGSRSPRRCAIHSFDHAAVRRAKTIAPALRCGILVEGSLADAAGALAGAGATDFWPERASVDRATVEQVHAAGGRVIAWTVNDPVEAIRLVALGVDALCSDDVPTIRRAVAPHERS